jgi:pimeloyl-ACP methyl ester carboxylesterase
MGGPVIVEAARRMPARVAGLVPVDTLLDVSQRPTPEQTDGFLKPLEADFRGGTEKFIREYMFVPTSDKALIERVVAMAQAAPPEVAIPSLRSTWLYDAEAGLRDVKAPIRALNGDKFPTNLEAARKAAPQFDAVIMKGVGHYLMLEDPGRFNTLLAGILKALAAPSEGAAARHKEE